MKIGCHAVLFTNRILTETENILSGLKSTGCEGVEIGSRFFGLDKREYLLETLNSQGLYLAGLHVSVQWLDLLNKYQISFCCWNLANKDESSSVFKAASTTLSDWTDEDFNESGRWIRDYFRKMPQK